MALKTFVKVSGVNNLSDARYCAGMEVNHIGFNIESSHPNYTSPQDYKELSEWLSGVEFVGEITSTDSDILALLADYDVHAIQVEDLAQVDTALTTGKEVIFATDDLDTAEKAWSASGEKLKYVLFDPSKTELDAIATAALSTPIVLAGGFTDEDVEGKIDSLNLFGIAMKGGDEIRPGYKDFDELADILEALEIDDLA